MNKEGIKILFFIIIIIEKKKERIKLSNWVLVMLMNFKKEKKK
jgi:hypothetical protein